MLMLLVCKVGNLGLHVGLYVDCVCLQDETVDALDRLVLGLLVCVQAWCVCASPVPVLWTRTLGCDSTHADQPCSFWRLMR